MLQLVSWLKRERQSAVAQPTSQTQKRHMRNLLLANLMPTRTHGIKKIKNCFSEGEGSDMNMSVAAQCSAFEHSKLWPKRSGWQLWKQNHLYTCK